MFAYKKKKGMYRRLFLNINNRWKNTNIRIYCFQWNIIYFNCLLSWTELISGMFAFPANVSLYFLSPEEIFWAVMVQKDKFSLQWTTVVGILLQPEPQPQCLDEDENSPDILG